MSGPVDYSRAIPRIQILALAVFATGCYLSHGIESERERTPDAAASLDSPVGITCDPMGVRTVPTCTVGVPGYWWWDGDNCRTSACGCGGRDCGDTFSTEAECIDAFDGC